MNIFANSNNYPAERISREVDSSDLSYPAQLLIGKVEAVRSLGPVERVVDLGCGNGKALQELYSIGESATGVDLTWRYLERAKGETISSGDEHVNWVQADATALPMKTASVDLVYSFSTLYIVSDLPSAIGEISRVLRLGGSCILDLGNSRSLNALCVRQHPDWAQITDCSVPQLRNLLRANQLEVTQWRSFQILPLWADRPWWLWPLLHPIWERILRKRLLGKLLDEWISSMPLIRNLAFRHLVICQRTVDH